jgi:exodeoxyribonuclease III
MKAISYNVNGIRAALKKGLWDWVKAAAPDILCLQETKAHLSQVSGEMSLFESLGYKIYWHEAVKKGYSGVAILSLEEPKHVEIGCGIAKYDEEGRVIRADYSNFSIISVYMPSGSSGDLRQDFKYGWLDDFYDYTKELKEEFPRLVISGDYNICHKEIDIHNPKSNANSSGFLPDERAWMSKFIDMGFVDTFRYFNEDPHNYSWWSYRMNARERNLGWRIDYHMASLALKNDLIGAKILPLAKHSDHCPVVLELDFKT